MANNVIPPREREEYTDPLSRKLTVVEYKGKKTIQLRGDIGPLYFKIKEKLEKEGRGGATKSRPHYLYWDIPSGQDPKKFMEGVVAQNLRSFQKGSPKLLKKNPRDQNEADAPEVELAVQYLIDSFRNDSVIPPKHKADIEKKLVEFKEMITNDLTNDEEMTKWLKGLLDNTRLGGYPYSIQNDILINIQNKNHGIVNSEGRWVRNYNRRIKIGATPIYISHPLKEGASEVIEKTSREKMEIRKQYFAREDVTKKSQLSPNGKNQLEKALHAEIIGATRYVYSVAYDESDTEQIEGEENVFDKYKETKTVEEFEFEESMISDNVKPVYKAVLNLVHSLRKDISMDTEIVDALESGVETKGNKIQILRNAGDDVGLTTKILAEIYKPYLTKRYQVTKKNVGDVSRDMIKNQGILAGWMTMYVLGFDVKRASVDHAKLWGGNKQNLVPIFEAVSYAVNKVTAELLTLMGRTELNEGGGGAEEVTPEMIADFLGIEQEFAEIKRQEEIKESLRNGVNNF